MTITNIKPREALAVMACEVGALDPQVRAEHFAWIREELPALVQTITELPDGLELQLPVEALPQIAAFIDRERRCCQFLRFGIEVTPTATSLRLRLTGPSGVADFLRTELHLRATR